MKTKRLFYAAVLPLALAACSEEQFLENANNVNQDKLGTLVESPLLGVNLTEGMESRAFDKDGKWAWIPEGNGESVTNVNYVGLCWTGVGTDDITGPLTETKDMVWTNYKFAHVGWLKDGETAPKLHCGELANGAYHAFNNALLPQASYSEEYSEKWYKEKTEDLDLQKGVFKSEHATIYGGEYIVYSPYNDAFWNAPVTAIQDRTMELTVSDSKVVDPTELMSKYAFNVGYMSAIKGGDEACEFSTKMLSSGLNIRYQLKGSTTKKIKEIVLWSANKKFFLTKQALSASVIKKEAAKNYFSKAVFMESEANEAVSNIITKMSESLGIESTQHNLYIPFLPATDEATQFAILLVADDGTTAVIDKTIDFGYGQPKATSLYFDGDYVYEYKNSRYNVIGEFKSLNYAYDNDSFWAAYEKAYNNKVTQYGLEARTVYMLGDITLNENKTFGDANEIEDGSLVEVMSAENGAVTLTLSQSNDNVQDIDKYYFQNTTFGVNIKTNPKGCCETDKVCVSLNNCRTLSGTTTTINGGTIYLGESTKLYGNLLSLYEPMDEEGNYHTTPMPQIWVTSGATIEAYGKVQNQGLLRINAANETRGKGELNLMGGALLNDSIDIDGKAFKGTIQIYGVGVQGKDGTLKMEKYNGQNATLTNKGLIDNMGNIDNNSAQGTFTNEAGATFVDYVGSTLAGHRIVNKHATAEFISEVNSENRYINAVDMNGIRPTTTVRFVYGSTKNIGDGEWTTTYILKPNNTENDSILVPDAVVPGTLIKFESAIDADNTLTLNEMSDEDGNPVATTIGDLTVKSGKVTLAHKSLKIDGDYTANGAQNTWIKIGLAVTGNMDLTNVTGGVKLSEKQNLIVGGDINVGNVTNDVTFDNASTVTAANMTVNKNNKVVFEKNQVTKLGEKGKENGNLVNNGSVDIVNTVSGSDVAAKVWCNSRSGEGVYLNSYPQYYK